MGPSIVIPENYFKINYEIYKAESQGNNIIELGTTYQIIREKIAVVKNRSEAKIVGFGDMTVEEIAKDSGLPLYLAKLAKQREYSEPFKILNGHEKEVCMRLVMKDFAIPWAENIYMHLETVIKERQH